MTTTSFSGQGRYSAEAEQLTNALLHGEDAQNAGNYLPGGNHNFAFHSQDGYAVIKIPLRHQFKYGEPEDPVHAERSILALERCVGIIGAEQFIERHESSGITTWATQFAAGSKISSITATPSHEHQERLVKTVRDVYAQGVLLDASPSNILHDPPTGITLIDFQVWPNVDIAQHLKDSVIQFSRNLFPRFDLNKTPGANVPEDVLLFRSLCKQYLGAGVVQGLTE